MKRVSLSNSEIEQIADWHRTAQYKSAGKEEYAEAEDHRRRAIELGTLAKEPEAPPVQPWTVRVRSYYEDQGRRYYIDYTLLLNATDSADAMNAGLRAVERVAEFGRAWMLFEPLEAVSVTLPFSVGATLPIPA